MHAIISRLICTEDDFLESSISPDKRKNGAVDIALFFTLHTLMQSLIISSSTKGDAPKCVITISSGDILPLRLNIPLITDS